jgi:polynucleotide 5'-hydroxyl-kinase GRC3/NOL9
VAQDRPHWEIPGAWAKTLETARAGGTLMLVGAVDSGKSTLAAILASAAFEAGRVTAVVDADVGQSSIGPPACVGLGRVTEPIGSLEQVPPYAIDFVGSVSPAGHLLQCATSAGVMARAAREAGAETLVVDTTGLIAGGLGRALKAAKIRILDPDLVVALQSDHEAEHLLTPYAGRSRPQVHRLPQARAVKTRTREERASRRQRNLEAHFAGGRMFELDWSSLPAEGTPWTTGPPLPGHMASYAKEVLGCEVLHAERPDDGLFLIVAGRFDPDGVRSLEDGFGGQVTVCPVESLSQRLIGLLGEQGETLCLGILEDVDFGERRLSIFAPVADISGVRGMRLGAVRVSRDGTRLA